MSSNRSDRLEILRLRNKRLLENQLNVPLSAYGERRWSRPDGDAYVDRVNVGVGVSKPKVGGCAKCEIERHMGSGGVSSRVSPDRDEIWIKIEKLEDKLEKIRKLLGKGVSPAREQELLETKDLYESEIDYLKSKLRRGRGKKPEGDKPADAQDPPAQGGAQDPPAQGGGEGGIPAGVRRGRRGAVSGQSGQVPAPQPAGASIEDIATIADNETNVEGKGKKGKRIVNKIAKVVSTVGHMLPSGIAQGVATGADVVSALTGGKKKRKGGKRVLTEKMKKRNALVSKLMKEQGMSLGQASKHIKENKLV